MLTLGGSMLSHGRFISLRRLPACITRVAASCSPLTKRARFPTRIWEVAEGALTDSRTEVIFLGSGQPDT